MSEFLAALFVCKSPRARDSSGRLRTPQRHEEWMLRHWSGGPTDVMKCWLSTLRLDTPLQRMVRGAKIWGRIERDCQGLEKDLGLGHDEGWGWRGFDRHASSSMAAYGFLWAQQLRHQESEGKSAARSGRFFAISVLLAGQGKVHFDTEKSGA